jgi:DNA ligase-1
MTSDDIAQVLNVIAEEPKRTTKEEILKELFEDELFKKIVKLAYDPFITFGVLEIPAVHSGRGYFNTETFNLLSDLADRTLTGNLAREMIISELMRLTEDSGYLFRAILKKDLRAGFNVKSIDKVCPGLIPTFPYMRCSQLKEVNLDDFQWSSGVYSQEKADGMFVNLNTTEIPSLYTRQGQPFDVEKFTGLIQEVKEKLVLEFQYHGEMVVRDRSNYLDRKTGNGILTKVLKGGNFEKFQSPVLLLWDMIPLDCIRGKTPFLVPYKIRFEKLRALLQTKSDHVRLIPTEIVYSFEEAEQHFELMHSQGYEGTIFKDPRAIWKNGTSNQQVKMKEELECDLRVLWLTKGTGKNEDTFGALHCASEDHQVIVDVSGFSDEERLVIAKNPEDWIGSIISIKFNSLIQKKVGGVFSLFLPRFVEKREDKTVADTLEYIKAL